MNLTTAKKLNNGVMMPIFGLGVYKSGDETYDAVRAALDAGYRHIDTAVGIKKFTKKHLPKSLYISGGVFLYKNMTGETYWKFS